MRNMKYEELSSKGCPFFAYRVIRVYSAYDDSYTFRAMPKWRPTEEFLTAEEALAYVMSGEDDEAALRDPAYVAST